MKKISFILFLLFVVSSWVNAECLKDQYGNVVCGPGECATDHYGTKVYCAKVGGGAMVNQSGAVVCGIGRCSRDARGRIWCSKIPGGGVGNDNSGNVKCYGGCHEASQSLCEEGS